MRGPAFAESLHVGNRAARGSATPTSTPRVTTQRDTSLQRTKTKLPPWRTWFSPSIALTVSPARRTREVEQTQRRLHHEPQRAMHRPGIRGTRLLASLFQRLGLHIATARCLRDIAPQAARCKRHAKEEPAPKTVFSRTCATRGRPIVPFCAKSRPTPRSLQPDRDPKRETPSHWRPRGPCR